MILTLPFVPGSFARVSGRILSCFFISLAILSLGFANPVRAAENPLYASFVMDADTGVILSQSYANKKLHPASLTKIMTLLMAFEAVENGSLRLTDRIRISPRAAGMAPSKIGLKAGSTIKVEDAIYALVTKSANDIAVAVAEHLGGTESNFARMMTARAHEIGMTNTTFRNASGLHDKYQISTARDMAQLARLVINDYPQYYRYFGTKNFTYQGYSYHNHNRLMDSYKGMDGMKTGYIGPSGFNLVASAVRNDRRVIGVVFGGRTAKTRNAHMAKLLDRGFDKMGDIRVAQLIKAPPVPSRKPGILVALNTLNDMVPAGGSNDTAAQAAESSEDLFARLIGEGDSDPAVATRLETGMMAVSAVKGEEFLPFRTASVDVQQDIAPPATPSSWSIQIGAFASRASTDQAIQSALGKLPRSLAESSPMIVPLRTGDGALFRGRLAGYSREQAFRACQYLDECLPVPPNN